MRLEIKKGIPAWAGQVIDFGQNREETAIAAPGSARDGKGPGITVHAESLAERPGTYRLTAQCATGDPVVVTLAPSEHKVIEIPRRVGILPYEISLNANAGPGGAPHEVILRGSAIPRGRCFSKRLL